MSSRTEEKRRQRERDRFIKRLLGKPARANSGASDQHSYAQLNMALTLAQRQLGAGQTAECDATCRQILASNSNQPEAIHLLGMACHMEGAHKQAVDLLKRATALSPENPEYHANLGSVYGQSGQFSKAVSSFRKSLKLYPDSIEVIYNLGLAHVQLGEFELAVEAYETAIAARPDLAVLHQNCGGALQMLARYDAAEACYRKAIALEPGSADGYFNLGTVLGRLRRFADSLEAFEQALEHYPDHPGALKGIAETRLKTGDNAGAGQILRRATTIMPEDRKLRYDLAHALALSGESREAVEICENAAAMAPPTIENLMTLGVAYICDGRHEDAVNICDTVLAAQPGHTSALAFKSTALNELGRVEDSRYLLDLDSLVQCFELAPPPEFRDLDAFNEALCRHIRNHPTLHYSPTNRSLKQGQATLELLEEPMGPFAAFENMIRDKMSEYRKNLTVSADHPFILGRPERLKLEVWANIMDSDGFHDTHFHPTGWLSGTYYPALPPTSDVKDDADAGCLEFGRSLYSLPTKVKPGTRTIRTSAGTLVLFPSYFGHRTIPFKAKEKRYSIAFDAVPAL